MERGKKSVEKFGEIEPLLECDIDLEPVLPTEFTQSSLIKLGHYCPRQRTEMDICRFDLKLQEFVTNSGSHPEDRYTPASWRRVRGGLTPNHLLQN